MIKLRQHIAFLLFGLFLAPIIFQSLHVLWHHSHAFQCVHHHCHKASTEQNVKTTKNFSIKESRCPICDYQFSINDLPNLAIIKTEIPVLAYTYVELAIQEQCHSLFPHKTPRAPPIRVA